MFDSSAVGARQETGQPLEHAAGADRGELRRVTYHDELRAGLLDRLGDPVPTVGVCHPSLAEMARRGVVDMELVALHTGHARVQREGLSGKRWTVMAEVLCG
jgi:hypothetical protein